MKIILYGESVIPFNNILKNNLPLDSNIISITINEKERFHKEIKDAQVLITNKLDTSLMLSYHLKLVQCSGVGYDDINIDCIPSKAYFCNVGEHENGMAEFVLLAMLSLNWNIIAMHNSFAQRDWSYSSRMGGSPAMELSGKTVGIVGYGRTGQTLAKKLYALEINVFVCSRHHVNEAWVSKYYAYEDLGKMAERVDYMVIVCDVRKGTIGLIDSEIFEMMKETSFLINISRGPIVKEKALYLALKNKKIQGAHIDVWYNYPTQENKNINPSQFPFETLNNVHMTPHVAGWTQKTVQHRWKIISNNVRAISTNNTPVNIVKNSV